MKRHFWYLSCELVVLAFFSDKVSFHIKDRMAAKFLLQPPIDSPEEREVRDEALFGKPVFPVLRNEDIDEIQLLDFIGGDSRFFFELGQILLNIEMERLKLIV